MGVPAALGQWKCKVQLHLNLLVETQNRRAPCRGSQQWRHSDPGFKEIWGRLPDQSHQAFIAWPESPGSSSYLQKKKKPKTPGLTPGSLETRRVLAGATVSEVPEI